MSDKDKRPFEEAISSLERIKKYSINTSAYIPVNVDQLNNAVEDIVNTLISLFEEIKESKR